MRKTQMTSSQHFVRVYSRKASCDRLTHGPLDALRCAQLDQGPASNLQADTACFLLSDGTFHWDALIEMLTYVVQQTDVDKSAGRNRRIREGAAYRATCIHLTTESKAAVTLGADPMLQRRVTAQTHARTHVLSCPCLPLSRQGASDRAELLVLN